MAWLAIEAYRRWGATAASIAPAVSGFGDPPLAVVETASEQAAENYPEALTTRKQRIAVFNGPGDSTYVVTQTAPQRILARSKTGVWRQVRIGTDQNIRVSTSPNPNSTGALVSSAASPLTLGPYPGQTELYAISVGGQNASVGIIVEPTLPPQG